MGLGTRCPEAETLTQLSQGELRGRRRRVCLQHLRSCPACRAEVAASDKLSRLLTDLPAPSAASDLPTRISGALASAEEIPSSTCRQARALINVAVDGEAATSQEERLWAHLYRCAPCLRRYRETEALVAVPRRAPNSAAPTYLPQRILAALAQLEPAPHRRAAPRPAPVALALAGAAALVLVAFIGLRSPRPGPVPVAAQPRAAAASAPVAPGNRPTLAPLPPATAPLAPGVLSASSAETRRGFFRSFLPGPPGPAPGVPAVPDPSLTGPAPARNVTPGPTPAPAPVLPVPAYIPPPAPAPWPSAPAALASAPAPAPTPSLVIASAPRTPAAPPPAPAIPGPAQPVVGSSPPEDTRPLRWTPSQPASMIVIHRQPGEHDTALADAGQALTRYGRELKRSQPKQLVVAR